MPVLGPAIPLSLAQQFALGAVPFAQTPSSISDQSVATSLADVALSGSPFLGRRNFDDIDALIRARTPQAISLLRSGGEEALRLSREGQLAGTSPLEKFTDLAAFDEQSALLGLSGLEAQEQAIGNLPVSEFNRQLQDRQRKRLLRGAASRGELSSGATLEGAAQLAGAQQADNIQRRLAELEPLVSISRGVRTQLSAADEAARARQAQLQQGLGVQEANIRLGTTAPLIESIQQEAEISGLRGIQSAGRSANAIGQLANVAGQFSPQISSFFQPSNVFGTPVGGTTIQAPSFSPSNTFQPIVNPGGTLVA